MQGIKWRTLPLTVERGSASDGVLSASHVDTKIEVLTQRSLAEFARGRTTFVLAHRLSTVHGADYIVPSTTERASNGNPRRAPHDERSVRELLARPSHDLKGLPEMFWNGRDDDKTNYSIGTDRSSIDVRTRESGEILTLHRSVALVQNVVDCV